MEGEGNQQLVDAMGQLLIQDNARKNFLQASQDEVNLLIPFNGERHRHLHRRGQRQPTGGTL